MRLSTWIATAACLGLATTAEAQDSPEQRTASLLKGSKATIENQACCGASRGTVHASEAAAIARVPGSAARNGQVLRLKLDGNRTLSLTDCLVTDRCDGDMRVHRLVGWWPKYRLYVVNVALYEAGVAYLVSQRDGHVTVATAPPVLSPSGRWAVALESNQMNGVDLELLDMSHDPPTVTKIEDGPNCPGAGPGLLRPKPVWVDESQIRFEAPPPLQSGYPNTKQLLRIIGGKPRWEC
ncbi:hypothetical protein [Reyranella sp.]|uniref:hypothetical protein n=1 Tax=Reyranella sp. TaxID=1929291 RepID=UPI0037838F5D